MQRTWRTLRTAAWLGWQIESNWTDPWMFLVFSVLKPLSAVLILVFMYGVVAGVNADDARFAALFVGNAAYLYVGAALTGASFAVLDDRERYRTLKYLYIAPITIPVYLIGRALARLVIGTLAVAVTLLVGGLAFGLPLNPLHFDWPLLLSGTLLTLVSMVALGVGLGAFTLTLRNEPWAVGEAAAGAMFLFSGAIFPLEILPGWLRPIGFALPVSYWLETVRRATLPAGVAADTGFTTFAALPTAQLLLILLGFAAALIGVAVLIFRTADLLARERGLIDTSSNF
jgi:ABC-2 type transport system permease protein